MTQLTEQDITDITVALVTLIMNNTYPENKSRYSELHDRIQKVRRFQKTFVSVDLND